MNFAVPPETAALLRELDSFIDEQIAPLQQGPWPRSTLGADSAERFFDHRREFARTDSEHGGVPRAEWEALLAEMKSRADAAGFYRLAAPVEFGGRNASNLTMAVVREHLAHRGLGLHNDLQNESSIVGNFPTALMVRDFGNPSQRREWLPKLLRRELGFAFGLTEPDHGSDATWMETFAVLDRARGEWVINLSLIHI